MRKILIAVMAVAMVFAFAPKAGAAESAQLGLQVKFESSEPLRIWSEPVPLYADMYSIEAGKTLEFKVIAEDKDAINVTLGTIALPDGAEWIVDPDQPISINRREGAFRWTPAADSSITKDVMYEAVFGASNGAETKELKVQILVINRIISIEMNEPSWVLDGVRLGEIRSNLNAYGIPIHMVKNTGNVYADVVIRYSPDSYGLVHPGETAGKDTFVTMVTPNFGNQQECVISPDSHHAAGFGGAAPGNSIPLRLRYFAPTGLSQDIEGMRTEYEIIASGNILKD